MRELTRTPRTPTRCRFKWCSIGPTQRGDAGDVRMRSFFPTFEQPCLSEHITTGTLIDRRLACVGSSRRRAPSSHGQPSSPTDGPNGGVAGGLRLERHALRRRPWLWAPRRHTGGRAQVGQVVNRELCSAAPERSSSSSTRVRPFNSLVLGSRRTRSPGRPCRRTARWLRDLFGVCRPYLPVKRRPKTGQRRLSFAKTPSGR